MCIGSFDPAQSKQATQEDIKPLRACQLLCALDMLPSKRMAHNFSCFPWHLAVPSFQAA